MFQDFNEWTILFFENVLLFAHDAEDARRKFDMPERLFKNVFLSVYFLSMR